MLKRLAYYLLPVNVLIDTLLLFSEQFSWLPPVRAGLLLGLVLYVFFKYKGHMKYYPILVLFLLYCLIQLAFVTDPAKSLNITMKVCIPIASFIVGFQLFNTIVELRKLSMSIIAVFFILIANFAFSQIFGLGNSVYSEESDFRVGNLDDAWNVFTYSILLTPMALFFADKSRWMKWSAYAGSIVNAMLVAFSIKRIAILGLVTGTGIRWLFALQVKRIMKSLIGLVLGIAILYPFFGEMVEQRIQARSDRFESGALEREGRFLESRYVWDEVLSFDDPIKSLFGLQGFYSVGNYADGRFGDRQLHVDYNLIVNTIGLVGLFLYMTMFVQLALLMRRVRPYGQLEPSLSILIHSVFWMLLLNQFITSFAGQMYHVSYRLIVFVFLGAILGTYHSSAYASTHRLQRK
jgi:hypothetical protein